MSELFTGWNTNTATRIKQQTRKNRTQRTSTNKIDLRAKDRPNRIPESEFLHERVSSSSQPILVWAVQTSFVLTEQEYSFVGLCSLPVHLESKYMSKHWNCFERHEHKGSRRYACNPFVERLVDIHSKKCLCCAERDYNILEENFPAYSG